MAKYDKAIITIVIKNIKIDIEIPLKVKIADIDYMIKASIFNVDYNLISVQEECDYYFDNEKLEKELSFSEQGVWEGSIVKCMQ